MKDQCTLCAILTGQLDPNEVPLDYLQGSIARMQTHFVLHPSRGLAKSIERLFGAIASHRDTETDSLGAAHYARLAGQWLAIVGRFTAPEVTSPRALYVH